jgi:tripartite-type tricarboxylate transporter receptor subunit TctC
MFDQFAEALPYVRSKLIKAYAVTAKARLAAAPEIPTVDEAGLPGFYVSVWHGLWAPKGTPKEIVAKLNAAAVAAMADPDLKKRFADTGLEIPPPDKQTPEAFASFQKTEIEKWWPLINAADIRAE